MFPNVLVEILPAGELAGGAGTRDRRSPGNRDGREPGAGDDARRGPGGGRTPLWQPDARGGGDLRDEHARLAGHVGAGPALRGALAATEPGFHGGGAGDSGAGDWGEHGHFQRGGRCAAAEAALCRTGAVGAGRAGFPGWERRQPREQPGRHDLGGIARWGAADRGGRLLRDGGRREPGAAGSGAGGAGAAAAAGGELFPRVGRRTGAGAGVLSRRGPGRWSGGCAAAALPVRAVVCLRGGGVGAHNPVARRATHRRGHHSE